MLAVTALNSEQHLAQTFLDSPVIIGAEDQFGVNGICISDPLVEASQCEIRWYRDDGKLTAQLTNLGRSIAMDSGPRVHSGVSIELDLPVTFHSGDTTIQIFDPLAQWEQDASLTSKPISQFNLVDIVDLKHSPAPTTLASWFDALGQLQATRAGSHEFFKKAARACFCPGGLDGAMVLQPTSENWEIVASHICYPEHGFGFRRELLDSAVEQRAVIFHDAQKLDNADYGREGHSIIVCPIFDVKHQCIAALYGFRSLNRRNNRRGIRPLEACFVEVITQSLSTGLARLESDANAAKARVLLEQAFSPQVATKLQQNPRILEGQDREVTVLFCDLRGFSTISERIGPKRTHEFLADVMDSFSDAITKHDGVIIDFYGDGLSAFWNAPIDIPEHAQAACRCAKQITECMKPIEERWAYLLQSPIRVGVGVHTGPAQVGNSGSRTRLKYGPRGNTVNLAARLESATKQTGASVLITDETYSKLSDKMVVRRVCRAQLAGMTQATQLFELFGEDVSHEKKSIAKLYESALHAYEKREFRSAIDQLTDIQIEYNDDDPSGFLLRHCHGIIGLGEEAVNLPSTKDQLFPLFDSDDKSCSGERSRKNPKENMPDE